MCPLASSLCLSPGTDFVDFASLPWSEEYSSFLPMHVALNTTLRSHLQTVLPSISCLSILLLHISQLEQTQISPETATMHKRRRYHPSVSILEQVMVNVRRAIRSEDLIYVDKGRGAAIILPDVDQAGAQKISERVYNNVNLLQAETLIPPLTLETEIVFGVGSYPEQGSSLEQMLASASQISYRLSLRPAITTHLWDTMPPAAFSHGAEDGLVDTTQPYTEDGGQTPVPVNTSEGIGSAIHDFKAIPYLQLPSVLPARLKNLIAYMIASRIRCVPVGRDHQRLTVAMADPTDAAAIAELCEVTHMTIFPVSCDNKLLDQLLETKW